MILSDFTKALGQLSDRRFLRVLFIGVALTVVLLASMTGLFLWGINAITPDELTLGGYQIRWIDDLLSWAFVGVMLVASIFLMVPVASLFTGFFLEDVAAAVEAKHYPELPPVQRIPLADTVRDSVNFFGVLVAVNAGAMIMALIFLPFAVPIFWVVNGFLLGREYYQMVAMRRLGRAGANAARKRNGGAAWLAGTLMAAPLSIPLINLFIPVLGVATFTHLFHRLERQSLAQTA
ncbi:EI24 domain-containing protein [Actibacterium sp. 188UL27-1]|uniref:EI24 domain-containing protein n=1 Tax=Actibacterium sp. 188UL27-1 TaxID=2786961 RepID=UPI001959CE69|nr:EI24 domain-containing protein [Actibacterium sp. 188UL27-1]MBM7068087.1 EI24 domain-containing protein [Actibacterium sp. 188UL27-1]